ncbi:MAG: DNA polymerase I, partial [Ruaniaceae bacterium]|nr:DNA polymerase I [Ruaniaceae bacterium]
MLIDGHSMAFRAFFALPADNFVTANGVHTNAIYGFLSMLVRLIQVEEPTHLAVAFDESGGTFRTEEYSDYKATRDATPEAFAPQVPLICEALDAMGIAWLSKENYEADDILATLAREGYQ